MTTCRSTAPGRGYAWVQAHAEARSAWALFILFDVFGQGVDAIAVLLREAIKKPLPDFSCPTTKYGVFSAKYRSLIPCG